MSFPALPDDPAIVARMKRRRRVLNIVGALVILGVLVAAWATWAKISRNNGPAHVATKTVTIVSAQQETDGVHVRTRLDAPSPSGTSHELTAVIPLDVWRQTKVLWACYPPSDPGRGILRTPLDPACPDFVNDNN